LNECFIHHQCELEDLDDVDIDYTVTEVNDRKFDEFCNTQSFPEFQQLIVLVQLITVIPTVVMYLLFLNFNLGVITDSNMYKALLV
jgi:uncharacterized membrane protein